MDNYTMMFGTPKQATEHTGELPEYIIKTVQNTFKVRVKRKYLGTFRELELAVEVLNEYLSKTK